MAEDAPLLKRLTSQVRGNRELALALLMDRGHMLADGTLTTAGLERQDLGADGRARDRASRASGRPASQYKYNPKTNRATLR